jgi:hypothetical protein
MVALAAANGGKAHVFNTTRTGCYIEREIRDDLVFAAKVDDARLDVWCRKVFLCFTLLRDVKY